MRLVFEFCSVGVGGGLLISGAVQAGCFAICDVVRAPRSESLPRRDYPHRVDGVSPGNVGEWSSLTASEAAAVH